jgi:alkanesulfonate monooxygenase
MFHTVPAGLNEFVDLVIPELTRRGIFRHSYAGTTLRDHLGLRRPGNRFFAEGAGPGCGNYAQNGPLPA